MRLVSRTLLLLAVLLAVSGCATTKKYNSLDLALLPCEQGSAPRFFRALEFDRAGNVLFRDQLTGLNERLSGKTEAGHVVPVTDLVLFVHGWNKNPTSAEHDYQDFLCRLHARLREIVPEQKSHEQLVVVGIFWPSTITEEDHDPVVLKPASYFAVRDRADSIAEKGLAPLFESWTAIFQRTTLLQGTPGPRVQLIGHSFGGRMLVRAMEIMNRHREGENNELKRFLNSAELVDVILLNAAVGPDRFEWLTQAVTTSLGEKQRSPQRSYLFNVHSFADQATRYLFPLASVFNDDPAVCAAGACGVPSYATLCVTNRGDISAGAGERARARSLLTSWNVDATPVISDHGDIYKGRIASLITTLMYDDEQKASFPAWEVRDGDTLTRCESFNRP